MGLSETPGLAPETKGAVAAYESAQMSSATAVMEDLFGSLHDAEGEGGGAGARADKRIEDAYARVSELAPARTPGRRDGRSYEQLLSVLRDRRLGETDGRRQEDPPVPWDELPRPDALLFGALDLWHYSFRTGRRGLPRLHDVPGQIRDGMSEEEIAGAHGDRGELLMRLFRLLDLLATGDGPEERRRRMFALGLECAEGGNIFYSDYADDPDYVEGFVRGRIERIREEEEEGQTHPQDMPSESWEAMWEDPNLPPEERRQMVLEPLMADCEIREGEGDLWRT